MENYYEIKPLVFEDAKLLRKWDKFENPLLEGYNYNSLTEDQEKIWFLIKQKRFRSEYFSIKNENNDLIGFIGLKNIDYRLKTAKLGIVISPRYVSKGYGKKVLKDFLDICFIQKKYKRINLEVNKWNIRAINLYKKFNFKKEKEEFQKFENQEIDLENEKFKEIRENFKIENGIIYSKIIHLTLNRREYI